MKQWEELSASALDAMKLIGGFRPTVIAQNREVKGYTYEDGEGGKCYLSSDDLRGIAAAGKWVAYSHDKGKMLWLGSFDDVESASVAVLTFRSANGYTERHGRPA